MMRLVLLAAALDVSRREACGLLDDLWTWALDIADPSGALPGLTGDDVATALDYPRKRGAWLMDALVRSGYVDMDAEGEYSLHDWPDYAGRLNDKRKDTKARVERYRERKKTEDVTRCNALQSVTKSKSNASTVPKPYPTVPKNEEEDKEDRARDWNPFGDAPERPPTDTVESYITANLSSRISPGMIAKLGEMEKAGATPELIRYAVDAACESAKGAPTWNLFETILRNWLDEGIRTVGQAKAAQERHKARKEPNNAAHRRGDPISDAAGGQSPPGSAGSGYRFDPGEIERIARQRGVLPPVQ